MSSGIYKIVNVINGKYYVGSSNDIDCRIYNHFRKLKMNIHENSHLQNAWNFYGESFFKTLTVQLVEPNNLFLEEQKQLNFAKTEKHNCYNQNFIAGCGPGLKKGTKFSVDHIKNLSVSHKGQKAWNKGKTKETDESVKKISCSKIGKISFSKSYTFVGTEEKVVSITNLKKFCRERHLTYTTMVQLSHGKGGYKTHKGWKRYV